MKTNKTEQINEFKKRFDLSDEDWNKFLEEYTQGENLQELCKAYQIKYDAFRYLAYSLGLVNRKNERAESVLLLQKDLARESGEDFDVIHEMEKELESVTKKNRQLLRSINLTRDENNNLRKLVRVEDRASNFEQEIKEVIETVIREQPTFKTLPLLDFVKENNKKQPFVLLSDTHYNELCNGEYIENYNEFNNQICLDGIDKVLTEVQEYGGDTLRVYLGGDLIAGLIHGLDKKGQVPVTQSVVELGKFLANRFNTLSIKYKKIKVMMVNGNHSRLKEKPVMDLKAFDFEHLMYEIMVSHITENNIETEYSLSGFLIDNIGTPQNPKYVVLFHGDNKNFNPTQEASVLKQFNIMDELFGVRIVSTVSGHTHKPIFTPNVRGGSCFVNGCMSGSNEYGFNGNFLPIKPYQWIGCWNQEGYADEQKCIRIR